MQFWAGQGKHLYQLTHAEPALARESPDCRINGAGIVGRGGCLEHARALPNSEPPKKPSLSDWAVHACTHAFGGPRQSLKIDMCSQIGHARIGQRINKAMPSNGLQRDQGSKPGSEWILGPDKASTFISWPIPVRSSSVSRAAAESIMLA